MKTTLLQDHLAVFIPVIELSYLGTGASGSGNSTNLRTVPAVPLQFIIGAFDEGYDRVETCGW
jgi:hypothetical protein